MMFTDVYTRWPGSIHVFKSSPLFTYLEKHGIPENGHILGDSAYRLSSYMLTPYRDNGQLGDVQKCTIVCTVRIETAFAIKGYIPQVVVSRYDIGRQNA